MNYDIGEGFKLVILCNYNACHYCCLFECLTQLEIFSSGLQIYQHLVERTSFDNLIQLHIQSGVIQWDVDFIVGSNEIVEPMDFSLWIVCYDLDSKIKPFLLEQESWVLLSPKEG